MLASRAISMSVFTVTAGPSAEVSYAGWKVNCRGGLCPMWQRGSAIGGEYVD
jgi:hypothetical protein